MSQARQGGALTPHPSAKSEECARIHVLPAKCLGAATGVAFGLGEPMEGKVCKRGPQRGCHLLSHRGTESENKERNQTGSHLVWSHHAETDLHWPWAIFLKQQALKHSKKLTSEKSKLILLSREGQEGRCLIGGTPNPLPGSWGRQGYPAVLHDLPSTSILSPTTDPAGTAQAAGPEAPEDGCQAAREPLSSEQQIAQGFSIQLHMRIT